MQHQLQIAADHLKRAQRLVVLSGAGVSKESGIPTYRDAQEGMWQQYKPEDLATPAAFKKNPKLVWDWYAARRQAVTAVQPNRAHLAIAALQTLIPQVTVVTQNVDRLHTRAGSHDVIELHGSIMELKCFDDCQGDPTILDETSLGADRDGVPTCPHCGAFARPNVVWFTEYLSESKLERARDFCQACDVLLVVGTSGIVQPAASLPYYAKRWGSAFVIDVNPNDNEIATIADLALRGAAGDVMTAILALLTNT
ncbi:MAG: NAD-dependent deacylase [Anaerolineae bacterium]|nr:NAD-dependent deacylase [Anaerolineae bacterium]